MNDSSRDYQTPKTAAAVGIWPLVVLPARKLGKENVSNLSFLCALEESCDSVSEDKNLKPAGAKSSHPAFQLFSRREVRCSAVCRTYSRSCRRVTSIAGRSGSFRLGFWSFVMFGISAHSATPNCNAVNFNTK
jgi:hypothetical protein